MTENDSQDLTQTQTQDGNWYGSQTESQETGEAIRPYGRIVPRRMIVRRLGNQSVTLQESLSSSLGN